MHKLLKPWDYLILTASNEEQAAAYKSQLQLRQKLGLIQDVKQIMTVSDPGGRRIGSGGSTIFCIMKVLQRELGGCVDHSKSPWVAIHACLSGARPCPQIHLFQIYYRQSCLKIHISAVAQCQVCCTKNSG